MLAGCALEVPEVPQVTNFSISIFLHFGIHEILGNNF